VFTAYVAVFLMGCNVPLFGRFTSALIICVALIPVWFRAFTRFQSAKTILILATASVVAGWVMAEFAPQSRSINSGEQRGVIILIATNMMIMCVLFWARQILPLTRIVLIYGIGVLLIALPDIPVSANGWKYQLSTPITLIVLSIVGQRTKLRGWLIALGVLGLIGVANDSRSYFGLCLLTGMLLAWYHKPKAETTRAKRLNALLVTIGGVAVFYFLASSLLISGYLGQEVQQRSLVQVQQGGSLILGGRPELAATISLAGKYPLGFGLGASPRMEEVFRAKEGLATVGLTGPNGYVDNYMFGGSFELHSIVSDFWAWFGIMGLIFVLYLGWLLIWGLTKPTLEKSAQPVIVFASVTAIWFLLFGPPWSNLDDVVLALAISLPLLTLKAPSYALDAGKAVPRD